MNLWQVGEEKLYAFDDPADLHWLAFWSWGSDEAVEQWKRTYPDKGALPDVKFGVSLVHSPFTPMCEFPHVEHRNNVLRKAGWKMPNDGYCERCELYEFDGEFPLCGTCACCDLCCECAEASL